MMHGMLRDGKVRVRHFNHCCPLALCLAPCSKQTGAMGVPSGMGGACARMQIEYGPCLANLWIVENEHAIVRLSARAPAWHMHTLTSSAADALSASGSLTSSTTRPLSRRRWRYCIASLAGWMMDDRAEVGGSVEPVMPLSSSERCSRGDELAPASSSTGRSPISRRLAIQGQLSLVEEAVGAEEVWI